MQLYDETGRATAAVDLPRSATALTAEGDRLFVETDRAIHELNPATAEIERTWSISDYSEVWHIVDADAVVVALPGSLQIIGANDTVMAEAGGSRPKIGVTIGAELWLLDEDGPSITQVDPVTGKKGKHARLLLRSDDPQMNVVPLTDRLAMVTDFETGDVYVLDATNGDVERLEASDVELPVAATPPVARCS